MSVTRPSNQDQITDIWENGKRLRRCYRCGYLDNESGLRKHHEQEHAEEDAQDLEDVGRWIVDKYN